MNDDRISFLEPEWLEKYMELLNQNEAYKDAAHDWEGDFIFQIDADGETIKEPVRAYIDLWHGDCRSVKEAGPDVEAEYVYSGPLKNWKLLLEGKIDPIKGLMAQKFKLIGDYAKVMRYIKAASELVATAAKIPTKFPDE